MPEELTLTIDAGPDVAEATRDQITRELLETIHEYCGADSAGLATQPAPEGAKVGQEIDVVGKIVVLGGAVLSELLAEAILTWLKQMRGRFKKPPLVTIPVQMAQLRLLPICRWMTSSKDCANGWKGRNKRPHPRPLS